MDASRSSGKQEHQPTPSPPRYFHFGKVNKNVLLRIDAARSQCVNGWPPGRCGSSGSLSLGSAPIAISLKS